MNRIADRFEKLRAERRKALIPFITAGDPNPDVTVPTMHSLVASGADIIELGVPFSDPMADGPVIQKASERALVHHVGLHRVLDMVTAFRKEDTETPVVLMGYLNPIEVIGYEAFAGEAAAAGVDGLLTVDLPPEEGGEYLRALEERELSPIFLLAPTTDAGRMDRICAAAKGFVYYVAVKGVTGAANLDVGAVERKVAEIRTHTGLPVGVGFGIKDGPSAAGVSEHADAVIVGSALVNRIEALQDEPEKIPDAAGAFIHELREAMDAAANRD